MTSSLDSFAEILGNIFGHRSGGRRPAEQDVIAVVEKDDNDKTYLTPCTDNQCCRLTIVQITDVYTLDNFANLKTLLRTMRTKQNSSDKVISMLTGDFLSPYLLSSVDRGTGMMNAVIETPIDYLTWGNHEADIPHKTTCKHVKKYWESGGVWINSNMQSHDAMKYQVPFEVVEIESEDGRNKRRIGLVAVLSNDPKLYSHFKHPGAFGGATIEDPWETLRKYKILLENEPYNCDLIIPLEHLYVPENVKTCKEFDFPVILSGHDHHRIDEVIEGTRLIKPGMDGVYATVLEIVWENNDKSTPPKIRSTFVKTEEWEPCPILRKQTDSAYDVLLPLRHTQLAGVPAKFEPLTSKNARGSVCSMGMLVCSMLKSSLEQTREKGESRVDAVILMGGNIRGNEDYPPGSFISLETLESEIKSDEIIGVVPILGEVLAEGIEVTHAGDPISGWMQYDDGICEEPVGDPQYNNGRPTKVTMIDGKPIDPHRIYHVATKISDLTNGQSPPLEAYFEARPELFPAKGNYINIQTELMGFFVRNLFRTLWDATGKRIPDPEEKLEEASHPAPTVEEMEARLRHKVLDRDGDGIVSVEDIHLCLRDFLGLSVHEGEMTLAEYIHSYADQTGDGMVTLDDLEIFCMQGLPKETKPLKKWRESFQDLETLGENAVEALNAEMEAMWNAESAASTSAVKRVETNQTEFSSQDGEDTPSF